MSEKIDYGLTASASNHGSAKFLRITDIQNGRVDWDSVPFCAASEVEIGRYSLSPGDIVFARTGATTGKSFLIGDPPEGAVFASYLIRVRPGDDVLPSYLARYFDTPAYWAQVRKSSTGTAQAGVNATKLKALRVPVPPLKEQRRMVAILDEVAAVRRSRQEAIDLTEKLLRSTFLEMFGDPGTNPKGWPVCTIGDLGAETQYGTSSRANTEGRGFPIIRMGNMTYEGGVDLSDIKHVELSDDEVDKYTVRPGDLLFNRTNSPALVGKTAVWRLGEPYALAGYIVRVRFNGALAHPDYVSGYLNSEYGKALLYQRAKPSSNMSNLSASELRRLRIPRPPIELQNEFGVFVRALEHTRTHMDQSLATADVLLNALVQAAFRGEL